LAFFKIDETAIGQQRNARLHERAKIRDLRILAHGLHDHALRDKQLFDVVHVRLATVRVGEEVVEPVCERIDSRLIFFHYASVTCSWSNRSRSAISSISTILPFSTTNAKATRTVPPGAHTAPASPSSNAM